MIALSLLTSGIIWASVAAMVARGMLARWRGRRSLAVVRELADAVARDVAAGMRAADAVRYAVAFLPRHAAARAVAVECERAACLVQLGQPPTAVERLPGTSAAAGFLHVWAVSHRHGLPLAQLAEGCAADIDAQLIHFARTESAMAGARLTVMVLLALPVGAVVVGESMGLGSMSFLFGDAFGGLLVLLGTLMGAGGTFWTEKLSLRVLGGVGVRAGPYAGAVHQGIGPLDAARGLDIFAVSLDTGLPLGRSWGIAAAVWPDPELQYVSTRLDLGMGIQAWEPLLCHELFGSVARQATQSAHSGARLAAAVRAHAGRLRRQAADQATANAERMLVALAAPLTLCFLPMFVTVGLIPLAIGLAGL